MVYSNSSSASKFLVFGATGNQGGSTVDHLLASPKEYQILAVTRNPTSAAAVELKARGVEVVQADMSDKASVKAVMNGVDYVFANTTSYELGKSHELAEGQTIVDAAKAAGVKMFFWSGNLNVTKGSGGKLTEVGFFDVKEEIFEYAKAQGLPTISIDAAAFFDNLLQHLAPRKLPNGVYNFASSLPPTTPLEFIAIREDYGAYVVAALEQGLPAGTELYAVSEKLSFADIAETWGEINGQKASAYQLPGDMLEKFAGKGIRQMQQWFFEFGYYADRDQTQSIRLTEGKRTTFRKWCEKQDWSKILA